ncbi:MAG: hypothetical protein GY834_17130 [Bacteroidetes bacterium]|nr:hypothetical protein [Bacteroidota bacterium]
MGKHKLIDFDKLRKELFEYNSDLRLSKQGNTYCIEGSLPIFYNNTFIERYLISVDFSRKFPDKIPIVNEIGGKLPKIPDRHFEKNNENACVCLKEEWKSISSKYPTIIDFLKGPITDFFLWQACFDYYSEDRIGGWAHGIEGRIDYYKQLLKTTDLKIVQNLLYHIAEYKYKPNWECYCGSGIRACKCHRAFIIQMRSSIPKILAQDLLDSIRSTR